jgi:hypothetical protein
MMFPINLLQCPSFERSDVTVSFKACFAFRGSDEPSFRGDFVLLLGKNLVWESTRR